MKNIIYIALFDTTSIQQYVFASNKLKENIGASYIVENLFNGESIQKIASQIGLKPSDIDKWKNKSDELLILNEDVDFEIGYAGGGNCFLIFKGETKELTKQLIKIFVQHLTKELLVKSPGVRISVAYEYYSDNPQDLKDKQKFIEFKKTLYQTIKSNQYKYSPNIFLNHHGITSPCNRTDLTSEKKYKYKDSEKKLQIEWLSSVSYNKLSYADSANERLIEQYNSILGSNFTFTLDIENIGQKENLFNYIAIVHIDGNGIGKKFEDKDLFQTRELSINLDKIAKESFGQLVTYVTKNFNRILEFLNIKENDYPLEDNKKILPIRPVLLGGDDITFISEGRLGIYFAKKFIEFLKEKAGKYPELSDFSACAGVSIIKTKYPFYRGYELCNQLCDSAKKKRKDKSDTGSWIDFHIHQGRQIGSLEEIRELHFKSSQGKLIKRPYKLDEKDTIEISFETLVENSNYLNNKEIWPSSKVNELREAIWKDKASGDYFININSLANSKRGLDKFKVNSTYKSQIFGDSETPYFDMIELLDFYPFNLEQGNQA